MDKNGFQLRAKKKIFTLTRDVKRFDSHAVARQNKSSCRLFPKCHRKHSPQLRQAFLIPLHERAKHGFRVGMRVEAMPELFQFFPDFDVIVDLAVESDSEIAVFGEDRLVPRVQVDDFQARRTHREKAGLKYALLVGPPVDQCCRRILNSAGRRGPGFMRISYDSAQLFVPRRAPFES